MSKRTFGKSGEKILKDAIGQFKGIIAQINAGAKKVKIRLTANEKKVEKLNDDSVRLATVMSEALIAADNLEAILSKKVLTEPIVDPTDGDDDNETTDETVDADRSENTPSDESK